MNIVKYPGGKERELDIISKHLPQTINCYYEPFVGGGSVYLAMQAQHYFINDFSKDLMNLYRCIEREDPEFFGSMKEINRLWKSIDTYVEKDNRLFELYTDYRDEIIDEAKLEKEVYAYIKKNEDEIMGFVSPMNCGSLNSYTNDLLKDCIKKFRRMKTLNFTKKVISDEDIKTNILCIFKASFYMYVRSLYSHMGHYTNGFKAMLYLFIRDFCYSSMFRFNSNGEFNVPYGGISYNNKNYDKIFEKYHSEQVRNHMVDTTFGCMDYKNFLNIHKPSSDDFMFVDPPYDSSFSTYDQNSFDIEGQKELARYLLNECNCNFMLDIKYTDFISTLYKEGEECKNGGKLRIVSFDKNYSVSFMNRNARKAKHILIMNY